MDQIVYMVTVAGRKEYYDAADYRTYLVKAGDEQAAANCAMDYYKAMWQQYDASKFQLWAVAAVPLDDHTIILDANLDGKRLPVDWVELHFADEPDAI